MDIGSRNSLDTPAVTIDLDILDKNLKEMANSAQKAEVKLRPHTKTHKSSWIAKEQLNYGAAGITVAKLGEAEEMVAAGMTDILVAFPIVGQPKLERLSKLMEKADIIISTDNVTVARGLSDLGEAVKKKIPLYVDVNTGLNRCGKEPGEETVELIRHLSQLSGVTVQGLMTHAGHGYAQKTMEDVRKVAQHEAESLVNTQTLLERSGFHIEEVSVGSTPTSTFIAEQVGVTEMRPGAYVFGDRSQLAIGMIGQEQCAMKVVATVVSVPRPGVAIIDAGSKTFSSDVNAHFPGYGVWDQDDDVYIERLSEEHGNLKVSKNVNLQVGQQLAFIPNHCCSVTNLHNHLMGCRNGVFEKWITVDARGKVQ